MAIINQAFVDGAHVVVRAVEVHARQATSTASSILSSSISSTVATATADSPMSSFTSPADPGPTGPTSTGGNSSQNQQNNNTGTSSPLLFFVALGFGVVFTNLWIIVGVKYCFRYNARNRQMRGGLDENGEPINLENMPARPHRRRREKKLMTMDEVNEKFPMLKYKTWVAGRAKEGLPTAGGVSVSPSRANSVRSVEGVVPELPSKERESASDKPDNNATSKPPNVDGTSGDGPDNGAALTKIQTGGTIITKDPDHVHGSDDEDDEHINAALPPELVATSGDTCAICIDTLEDDDDVRGLTCGHAFHAVCLDPWLTNRRACCPLCKADYYTPKPRPPPVDGDPTSPASLNAADPSRNNGRLNMPRSPQRTFGTWTLRGAPRAVLPTRGGTVTTVSSPSQTRSQRRAWDRRHQETNQPSPNNNAQGQESEGWFNRFRGRFPAFRGMPGSESRTREPTASGTNNSTASPSQLEAGTGPNTTATS